MELEFDGYGRVKYNSEIHYNQREPWTMDDLNYLIEWYDKIGGEEISFALGRTETSIYQTVLKLRRKGIMASKPPGKVKHKRLLREEVLSINA